MKDRSHIRTNREGGAPAKTKADVSALVYAQLAFDFCTKTRIRSVGQSRAAGTLGRAEAKRGDDIGAGGVGIGVLIFLTHVNAFAP